MTLRRRVEARLWCAEIGSGRVRGRTRRRRHSGGQRGRKWSAEEGGGTVAGTFHISGELEWRQGSGLEDGEGMGGFWARVSREFVGLPQRLFYQASHGKGCRLWL
jgi:hypothetical protein